MVWVGGGGLGWGWEWGRAGTGMACCWVGQHQAQQHHTAQAQRNCNSISARIMQGLAAQRFNQGVQTPRQLSKPSAAWVQRVGQQLLVDGTPPGGDETWAAVEVVHAALAAGPGAAWSGAGVGRGRWEGEVRASISRLSREASRHTRRRRHCA